MSDKPKTHQGVRPKSSKRVEPEGLLRGKASGYRKKWLGFEQLQWLLLIGLSLIVALLLFPSILMEPVVYKMGDVAEGDIKASHEFLVENEELTEQDREKAVQAVLSVYDLDQSSSNLIPRIKEVFAEGRQLIAEAAVPQGEQVITAPENENPPEDPLEKETSVKSHFFALLEMQPNEDLFQEIVDTQFSETIERAAIQAVKLVLEKGIADNPAMLEGQIDKKGIILHEIYTKKEVKVTDFSRFLDMGNARKFVEKQIQGTERAWRSPRDERTTIQLAQTLIKPNLTFNQRATEARKDQARASINPIYFKIKRGEMLVREGERIGPEHLIRLTEYAKSQKQVERLSSVPAMAVLIGFFIAMIYIVGLKGAQVFEGDERSLIFNAVTLIGLFIFMWAYHFVAEEIARGFHAFTHRALLFGMPVAFGAMLISIFQGIAIATFFSLAVSVFASLLIGGEVEFFLYFFTNCLFAAYGVTHFSERGALIKTGLLTGCINIILGLSIVTMQGSLYALDALVASTFGFLGGLLAGVIATGILPIIEMSFGFTTDIKLLELAKLDQPLLRELMVQAPGTYHHSVITSNMVEATAGAVQANPLLAKVSAYYHDIGKITKPLYFIENQMGGENKHEKLAPSMSSLILISHVKDGVELAKNHRLGKEIIDIIQQHHGTGLISFFYQKAQDRMVEKGGKPGDIKEEDFRYPGPKPQTKEAGLVMLADMVEAATRSLVEPTPARIQGTVQKIINRAFSDGQLNDCELTLKDLHEIAKSFNKTLSGIFHYRIEYPEPPAKPVKKGKNGNPDKESKEGAGSKKSDDEGETEEGLRRLGLS